ncbi:MAG: ParB/RepB/Spo0J family partition protein [Thermodesulfobacteriota bacterium]
MRKNTLGRGLESLIPEGGADAGSQKGRLSLPLGRLKPGAGQPRKIFDDTALGELADSIKEKGLIQPLIVRKHGAKYEIIAGERRWRAAQKAGLREVPVIVREMADGESVEVALIENIQREDLNPFEEAGAYERLLDEFDLTHDEVAKRVGKSRAAITNQLRLLKLSPPAREALLSGRISMGHARAVLGLKSGADEQAAVSKIVSGGLSVRQTETLVRKINSGGRKGGGAKQADIYLKQAERAIRERLGARVKIEGGREKGRIVIVYSSADELERISFEMANESPLPPGGSGGGTAE